jgi:hypothetical protein
VARADEGETRVVKKGDASGWRAFEYSGKAGTGSKEQPKPLKTREAESSPNTVTGYAIAKFRPKGGRATTTERYGDMLRNLGIPSRGRPGQARASRITGWPKGLPWFCPAEKQTDNWDGFPQRRSGCDDVRIMGGARHRSVNIGSLVSGHSFSRAAAARKSAASAAAGCKAYGG